MLTLKVTLPAKSVTRSLRFNRQMTIQEALDDIHERVRQLM